MHIICCYITEQSSSRVYTIALHISQQVGKANQEFVNSAGFLLCYEDYATNLPSVGYN